MFDTPAELAAEIRALKARIAALEMALAKVESELLAWRAPATPPSWQQPTYQQVQRPQQQGSAYERPERHDSQQQGGYEQQQQRQQRQQEDQQQGAAGYRQHQGIEPSEPWQVAPPGPHGRRP